MHDHLPNTATVVAKFASAFLFPPLRFLKMCLFETDGNTFPVLSNQPKSYICAIDRSAPFIFNKLYICLYSKCWRLQ